MIMQFTTEHGPKGGVRFSVQNPPAIGAELELTDGQRVTFNGIGPAGMLLVWTSAGSEMLVFPFQIAREVMTASAPATTSADGCGCCGDACASRGSCRHADENPPPPGSAYYDGAAGEVAA